MKQLLSLLTIVGLLGAPVLAGDAFHVVQKVTTMGQESEVDTWLSGSKARVTMGSPMGKIVMLLDSEAGMAYTVLDAQKSYMELNLKQMQQMAQQQMPEGEPTIEKTKRTETLGEWKCQVYRVVQEGFLDMEVWVTQDIDLDTSEWLEMNKQFKTDDPLTRALDPAKMDGFPVKTVGKVTQGGQTVDISTHVTLVEKKPADASMFDLPAGYQKLDMGGMGNQFGQ